MAVALWVMGSGKQFLCSMETHPGSNNSTAVSEMTCEPAGSGLLVAGVMLFLLAFECGPGPLFFVIATEMFEIPRLKSVGLTYCNVVAWLLNIVITITFPMLNSVSGFNTYFLLASIASLTFVFLLCFLPETKSATAIDD